jgi:hypothetical protein
VLTLQTCTLLNYSQRLIVQDIETLRRKVLAWSDKRNRLGASVDWRFTTADARRKLRKVYAFIDTLTEN